MSDRPAQRRRRRTAAELEKQILDAAWAELVDRGWSGFRMDAVARRASVSKASLYDRWPSRGILVRASLRDPSRLDVLEGITLVDDLATNLYTVLDVTADFLAGAGGEAMRGIVSDTADGHTSVGESQLALVDRVLDRARAIGELGSGPVPLIVRNAGIAIVVEHFLFLGAAPPPDQQRTIVDLLWIPALRLAAGDGQEPPGVPTTG